MARLLLAVFILVSVIADWSVFVVAEEIEVLENNDPGTCNKTNIGKVVFVKDRQDKHVLIICSESNGTFAWSTADGSNRPGEFFSPAYDCSAILDVNPEAADGFYWINLDEIDAKKVLCDMTTDGGGFMLIGRKNIPSETLSSPSNGTTVEPYGTPHWSSALGNSPIVDFRVQMSDVEDIKTAKGHWFYRLRSPRKLKKLMLRNEGGCTETSPGIGDIAYVKDLITDKVVTRRFRCSKFGIGYHPSLRAGWNMMNLCLQRPCSKGFAYHYVHGHQTDVSGAFSYSTTNTISGMDNDATVFVGCDNGHCCGCYGPVGGKQNYCFKECQAKNGGKIITKVFTWFWVRSSLPKRIWNKCMEYNVTENGVTVWYKLRGGSDIPIKGRCSKEKPLFYNGMLVVPNKAAVKKVPSVEGMMVYQKSNQELYFTANKTLKELAEEKKVNYMLNKEVAKLERKIENVVTFVNQYQAVNFPSSNILHSPWHLGQLKQWLTPDSSWEQCWQASRDGWTSSVFHQRCDYQGPTVTIVKVESYIFGGYTDQSWGGSSGYRRTTKSFLFSFKNKYNLAPFKAPLYGYRTQYAIYKNNGYGPTFGGGHDLYIPSNPQSSNSYSNFGNTYRPPSGYSYGSSSREMLAGTRYFRPSEIEVFFQHDVFFYPSNILNNRPSYLEQLRSWLPIHSSWPICWRASRDGWSSSVFHRYCDNLGPTVTIVRVGSYIFGGYTDQSWGGSSAYRNSTKSFLFSLKNKYNLAPFKAPVYRYSQYAIYTTSSYGPTFGGGHDLHIPSNPQSSNSYSNFGNTYQPPYGYSYGSSNTQALLAGAYSFRASEIEVFFQRDILLYQSHSLNDNPSYIKKLKSWLPIGSTWSLCWRASRDGWTSSVFHKNCDNRGPTVTIVRVETYIFGGYTDQSWGGSSGYRNTTKSFLFSLKNKYNLAPFKAPVYRYPQYAIYTTSSYGPTFGGGHDLYIPSNPQSSYSRTNFGHTYQPPSGYSYGSSNSKALLAGSYTFRPSEIEVFFQR